MHLVKLVVIRAELEHGDMLLHTAAEVHIWICTSFGSST